MVDAVICADGGADPVLDAGLVPAVVLGDMDSLSYGARSRLQAAHIRMLEFPTNKDKTDLELALDHALTYAPERITVLGALGGDRLDHTLGNLKLGRRPTRSHSRQCDAVGASVSQGG
jgi:thiamine pyrophosphokinase